MLGHRWSVFQSCLTLTTPWTVARQDPLSMGLPRQQYWSGLPFPPPGDLRDPGIELESLTSPALAGRLFTVGATLVLALENSASACESLYKARLWGAHSIRASLQWETLWAPECAGPMFSSEALGQAGAGEQCGPPRLIPFRFKKLLGFWDSQRRGSSWGVGKDMALGD